MEVRIANELTAENPQHVFRDINRYHANTLLCHLNRRVPWSAPKVHHHHISGEYLSDRNSYGSMKSL